MIETTTHDLDERGRVLVRIAWEEVSRAAGRPIRRDHDARRHAFLAERSAVFVSLHRASPHGALLRGCLGSLEPIHSLLTDLCTNAAAVARRDPRFPPVSADELEALELEVTELGALRPLVPVDRDDLLARLRPGTDGLLLQLGRLHRATFLPQVWEDGRVTPAEFLSALLEKAGLPGDFWSPRLAVSTYTTRAWSGRWPGPI